MQNAECRRMQNSRARPGRLCGGWTVRSTCIHCARDTHQILSGCNQSVSWNANPPGPPTYHHLPCLPSLDQTLAAAPPSPLLFRRYRPCLRCLAEASNSMSRRRLLLMTGGWVRTAPRKYCKPYNRPIAGNEHPSSSRPKKTPQMTQRPQPAPHRCRQWPMSSSHGSWDCSYLRATSKFQRYHACCCATPATLANTCTAVYLTTVNHQIRDSVPPLKPGATKSLRSSKPDKGGILQKRCACQLLHITEGCPFCSAFPAKQQPQQPQLDAVACASRHEGSRHRAQDSLFTPPLPCGVGWRRRAPRSHLWSCCSGPTVARCGRAHCC